MNCHMPRLNEGMQDVVRTHMIFSPNNSKMLEANQPNACNQCHTSESIDWTLKNLADWYDSEFSADEIAKNYKNRDQPVAIGWLRSNNESVRLIAADSLFRTESIWAIDVLLDALNDSFLLNRQFARRGLERLLGVKLVDFGYRFYMMSDERKAPIEAIRNHVRTMDKVTEQ